MSVLGLEPGFSVRAAASALNHGANHFYSLSLIASPYSITYTCHNFTISLVHNYRRLSESKEIEIVTPPYPWGIGFKTLRICICECSIPL